MKLHGAIRSARHNSWPILSRVIAGYFIWAFHLHVGFPPLTSLTPTAATYLALSVFFTMAPYAQRLKLGKFIEFEARIERVQTEVKEVHTATRELLSTVSVLANAVSVKTNQNVVVNVPSVEDGRTALDDMLPAITHSPGPDSRERRILEYLGAGNSDVHYALARLRMELERELRRVLGKRLESGDPARMRDKFLSARALFRRLTSAIPRYRHMQGSFNYLLQVCNAAIHGQRLPEDVAHEAIDLGLRVLHELENEQEQGDEVDRDDLT
jgi:hypothetical protein